MTNTMTKREVLMALINAVSAMPELIASFDDGENAEVNIKDNVLAYAENELVLLDRKAGKAKSQKSKTQRENEGIKESIVNALTLIGRAVTISELIKEGEGMHDFSCQKLSALLKQLTAENRVQRIEEKKITRFAVA